MRAYVVAALIVWSALSLYAVTTRLRLDPDVAALLPSHGEAAALREYLRAFGGSDLAMVLIEAPASHREALDEAAGEIRDALAKSDTVAHVADRIAADETLDPTLVWRHADAPARRALREALTPEGMRRRLRGSRALLLAPGASAASERIARDPLRLWSLLREQRTVGGGFTVQADGALASDDGGAHLVLVMPRGQALRGADARAFVSDAEAVLADARAHHPALRFGLTGGHAIAKSTEAMLETDLQLSSILSLGLAALAFALAFRRVRALIAVMPPLALGTLWTAAVAALSPQGLSAIAVAFMSVVIGVGVDTGVHVYAALLEARREGLSAPDAAVRARRRTLRPVLVAAFTAAAAFAALTLSDIDALGQLGVLCAGGEILTAVAIVAITPEIGAYLERRPPRASAPPAWTRWVATLTASRPRALAVLALVAVPPILLAAGQLPQPGDALVAMRPRDLPPLEVQDRIYQAFGGRRGQWVVMVRDADAARAQARTDRIAEALSADDIDAIDTLTHLAPAPETQRERLAERDALDLPAKADALEQALAEVGFAPERFADALAAMRQPSAALVTLDALRQSPDDRALMLARYLGSDAGDTLVVSYVLPKPGREAAVEAAIRAADPDAAITGYARLETTLRRTLTRELPLIGGVAFVLVLVALWLSLRRLRDVALALAVVAGELALVLLLVRVFDVPLHAYDALVLPVLLGITVDEAMFLLYRARQTAGAVAETLAHEGPPVLTTALTTAAGFSGLLLCDFDGLRHLGMVGAIGSLTGLAVALLIVPAGLRLTRPS